MHPDNLGRQFGPKSWIPTDKPVFKNINVISHPELIDSDEDWNRHEDAQETLSYAHPHEMVDLPAHVEVHTTQLSVDRAGIRSYVDRPNDHTRWDDEIGFDAPQVYQHSGKLWVYEGHHRIIASRLRGEPSIKVQMWNAERNG